VTNDIWDAENASPVNNRSGRSTTQLKLSEYRAANAVERHA